MGEVQAAARLQQRTEELCVAAIRALARQRDLHFRGGRLHRGRTRLPAWAAHLHPVIGRDDFAAFRGAADALALRLRLSDEALHRRRAPAEPVRRAVFDLLEQFRVESLAGEPWPGVQRNLAHGFERWTRGCCDSRVTETARGLLLFAVAQLARAQLTGQPMPEAVQDLIEGTRARIGPALAPALRRLRRLRRDQTAYAEVARAVADTVAERFAAAGGGPVTAGLDGVRHGDQGGAYGFILDVDEDAPAAGTAGVVVGRSAVLEGSSAGYAVFSSTYDREFRPAATLRRAQLDEFRRRLDARVAAQRVNVQRLARQLQAALSLPSRDDWSDAQEEGLVDGRRLAQLIASPAERRLFRQELRQPQPDAALTFLIDCSGSMRQHVEPIATLVDVVARALELAGVPCEVLGFSTGAWNGGRPYRDWLRQGRPRHPGRLNETAHLVFKDARTPWGHARRDLAALLRPDLFREGVDGEALAWAARRLRACGASRKLLVAVSDGCPMDRATELANDARYLDHHLQQVAAGIEAVGDVELAALGVGLDLSPYYARCQAVDLEAEPDRAPVGELLELIAGRRRR